MKGRIMKDTRKKVTKTLAKEIAAKFFGRSVKLVEDVHPEKRRIFYGEGYVFDDGLVRLVVFPYFGGQSKDFGYPNNKYPYGQVFIDNECTRIIQYVDGKFETENCIYNENEELRNALFTIRGLLEEAIDEKKIVFGSDWGDKWIVKDKAKLLNILKIVKDMEEYL